MKFLSGSLLFLTFLLFLSFDISLAVGKSPFVILPSFFRSNSTNSITITPVKDSKADQTVDIDIDVYKGKGVEKTNIFSQKLQAKQAGIPQTIKFALGSSTETLTVRIAVERHSTFETNVTVKPDISTIHVHTDKFIYRAGERVDVRILPLTYANAIFQGPIEVSLVNPDNFELIRKTVTATDIFAVTSFDLPEHLYFGNWRVVARAETDIESSTFDASFTVDDYVLPPFIISFSIREGDPIEHSRITIDAKYYHGGTLNGSLILSCTKTVKGKKNSQSQPTQLKQSQIRNNEKTSRKKRKKANYITNPQFLQLAPPYHHIPNTPYFRQAFIIPPPIFNNENLPVIQRITNRYLSSMKIIDGYWKEAVSLAPCFIDNQIQSSTISVEIRDLGTGERGETQLEYDPLASSFDIIPLQPFFNSQTEEIPFITVPLADVTHTEVEVNISCIARTTAFESYSTISKIGEYFEIALEKNKKHCNVLLVEAKRVLNGNMRSRSKTIIIPYLAQTESFNPSWIRVKKPKGIYDVKDDLNVRVKRNETNNPKNYMVLCNTFDVISVGKLRDDGYLKIPITPNMIGECYLFVYSDYYPFTVDMILFFVNEVCNARTTASKAEIKPGHNVTFMLDGEPNGLALLRAINDRLNNLNKNSEMERYKSWDIGMFDFTDSNAQQSRLKNFVDMKSIREKTTRLCEASGALYGGRFQTCPEAISSNSGVSDFCLKKMIERCMKPSTRTTANSCGTESCVLNSQARENTQRVQKAGSIFSSSRAINYMIQAEPIFDEPVLQPDDDGSPIRQQFHDVWLFDAFKLSDTGSLTTTVVAPDDIGRWSIASAYWAPGHQNLCRAKPLEIVSKKNYFLEVNMPRHAYSNESVTVKVSVTSMNPQKETKLSICMNDLSKKICADVGANGRHGESVYSRVIVSPDSPIVTKTFTMKFLGDGPTNILFRLREEIEYPGKHHCDIGKIYDSVRIKTVVSRRVEAEEIYKILIVDPDRPLSKHVFPKILPCEDKQLYNYYTLPTGSKAVSKALEINECRASNGELHTQVSTNVLDSDVIQIFTLDIHKFLPNKDKFSYAQRRVKRNRMDYRSLFLNDVLMRLSVELYSLKSMRNEENTKPTLIQRSESEIGALISQMLGYSDCHGDGKSCGFAEYDSPQHEEQRDPLLTALSASLICQATIDDKVACGPLKFIEDVILQYKKLENIDISHLIDLKNPTDRRWFLTAMFLQVLNDCSALKCTRNEDAWSKLYFDYFDLDETFNFDNRTLAALAFLSTSATSEIMRIKMMSKKQLAIPFWTAGMSNEQIFSNKMSSFEKLSSSRKAKSGDVFVNSLGILSFIVPGAENEKLDWDPLTSWLYEQQHEDGTFNGVLDTFFAARAIHEYRYRKVIEQGDIIVKTVCENGPSFEINVTNSASEIYLPTHVRNFTLITKGHGKLRVGIHILVTKKQRSRRGLTQENFYPVRFSIDQVVIADGILKQTVCINIASGTMKNIEITHGIYTGYSLKPSNVNLHQNSSLASFHGTPSISSYAAHFIVKELTSKTPICYEVGLTEPNYHHEPLYLAPVALQAKHVFEGLVGNALITHPDQIPRFQRSSLQPIRVERLTSLRRKTRSIIEDSVDTVCFKGGTCTCAETTCMVKCGFCALDSREDLKDMLLNNENQFVALGEALRTSEEKSGEDIYSVIAFEMISARGQKKHLISKVLNVWLRKCNYKCLPDYDIKNTKIIIVGDVEGFSVDSDGEQHYVLRDTDRFETVEVCSEITTFALSRKDF